MSSSCRLGPDFVGGGAAAAVQLPGDPLTDLGDHEVGEGDEMPLVDCDPRVRQGGADPRIDRYNSARPHTRLGNAPPAEYEAAHCAEPTKSSRPAMTPA